MKYPKFNPTRQALIPVLAVAGILWSGSLHAATVFTDTFDAGTGNWYKAYNNGASTVLSNSGSGELSWATGSSATAAGAYGVIGRSFSEQTLAVGETIRLRFDYSQTSATGIMRVGLHNLSGGTTATADDWSNTDTGTYEGYATFIRDSGSNAARVTNSPFTTNANSAYPLYMSTSGGASATTITTSGDATNYTFANNTTYQVLFDITRTSLTQTDTLLTVLDGATTRYAVAGSQTSGTTLKDFDTATLRISEGTALFDNIQVSVIPEPSTLLLSGLGVLFFLCRRR